MLRGLTDRGVVVAIVSSNAEQNVRRVLGPEAASLVRHFACGASLLGKRTNLKAVVRASRVEPAGAIYVGDETRDVEAAKAVGMASGVVSWGYATPDALRAAGPTEVFQKPGEVVERLVGLRA